MSLGLELTFQNSLRLNFAEKNVSEEEVAFRGVWMVFEVLADGMVGFGELSLLEKGLRLGEKVPLDRRLGMSQCCE